MNKVKILVSFLLAFQAGSINTGAYIICHRFVSHITGFASLVGIDFAKMNLLSAVSMATVPLFFLTGVMFSSYFVDVRVAANKQPKYTFLILSIAFLLFISALGGEIGWFGPVESPLNSNPNFPLIAILCLVCGIQNASITSASGTVFRTTHLTGITTDLGLGLMKIIAHGKISDIQDKETRVTLIRIGIIGSFIIGSVVGAYAFFRIGFLGFLIPASISTGLLIWDLADRLKLSIGKHHD